MDDHERFWRVVAKAAEFDGQPHHRVARIIDGPRACALVVTEDRREEALVLLRREGAGWSATSVGGSTASSSPPPVGAFEVAHGGASVGRGRVLAALELGVGVAKVVHAETGAEAHRTGSGYVLVDCEVGSSFRVVGLDGSTIRELTLDDE